MLLMCLGVCVPLAVRTYGNWGGEAQGTFSRLALSLPCKPQGIVNRM